MNRKGFIFDLDGVLVDTARFHFIAWQETARSLGIHFTELENEELKGVSRKDSLSKILSWGNKTIDAVEFEHHLTEKNRRYLELVDKMSPDDVLEGAAQFLQMVKDQSHGIALGSASKNAKFILDRTNLLHYFDAIIDGNMVENSKPHPEVFLKGAKSLGIDPALCVVFEDSTSGIKAALRGGMKAIGIGSPEILNEAQLVWPSLLNKVPQDAI